MKLGIMQPYFMPYLGYWQLIKAVDYFVLYDDIEFTKKGWIHRNRFMQNGKDALFSLSLKKDSDFLNINQRFLAETNTKNIEKIIRQLESSYSKAPFYDKVIPLIKEIFIYPESNLFEYNYNSLIRIIEYLNIDTTVVRSSSLKFDRRLKSQDKVLDICRCCNASIYINAIGGKELYNAKDFNEKGIELKFIKMEDCVYQQLDNNFIPQLSIIDVLMFNNSETINEFLNNYSLE